MKFITYKEWLNEQAEEPKYGCVMLDAKMDKKEWLDKHAGGIDGDDVYRKPYDDSYGLEDNPHVTVLYGIHEDEIDPEPIHDVIRDKMGQITVTIDEIGTFENDEYDVVKYNVPVTPELKEYRRIIEDTFPNTQTFPEYNPHVTLAYVKPGCGKKYAKKLEEPFELTFNKGVYSWHGDDGVTTRKEIVFPEPEEKINLDLNGNS